MARHFLLTAACVQSYVWVDRWVGEWVKQQQKRQKVWYTDQCHGWRQEIVWIASNIQLTVSLAFRRDLSNLLMKLAKLPNASCVPLPLRALRALRVLRTCLAVLYGPKQGRLYYVTLRYGPSESATHRAHFWSVSFYRPPPPCSLAGGGERGGERQKKVRQHH